MMMEFDEELICKMLMSDMTRQKAFEAVVKAYGERLYWKIRCIVIRHDDADDVLQNTFVKAWTNIATFQHNSKLYTWLCSIAINESLDFIRKNKKNVDVGNAGEGVTSRELMADEYFDGEKAQALLLEAMSKLPDVQRTVFSLRYFNEVKYNDMSKMLNTSVGALKASYHIAVKKITDYVHSHE